MVGGMRVCTDAIASAIFGSPGFAVSNALQPRQRRRGIAVQARGDRGIAMLPVGSSASVKGATIAPPVGPCWR